MTNVYGDAGRFEPQSTLLYTLFSIGNTTKYPMSLQYILMTIGPAMLFLAARPVLPGAASVRLLGQVRMFYYLAHIIGAHLIGLGWRTTNSAYPLSSLNVVERFGGMPAGFGFPLWTTLALSFGLTLALLPACRCMPGSEIRAGTHGQDGFEPCAELGTRASRNFARYRIKVRPRIDRNNQNHLSSYLTSHEVRLCISSTRRPGTYQSTGRVNACQRSPRLSIVSPDKKWNRVPDRESGCRNLHLASASADKYRCSWHLDCTSRA